MKRKVVMLSPLGSTECEAWVVSDELGVIANPHRWVVDAITRQMKPAVGGDFEVVLLAYGIGVSPRLSTLYEALAYANYLRARHTWNPIGDLASVRVALRRLHREWVEAGGYLVKY